MNWRLTPKWDDTLTNTISPVIFKKKGKRYADIIYAPPVATTSFFKFPI